MKIIKPLKYLIFIFLVTNLFPAWSQVYQLDQSVKFPDHPRLLFLDGQEKNILSNIKNDQAWKKIHQSILTDCNSIINRPVLERIKIGRRLLDVSRECLRRIFYLSYAYRITSEVKYLKRAEKEMLAVAAFSDWNPSHFLDVGEMTMAVAIGYDWLYNGLSESSRSTIKEAILKKGIEPSLDAANNSWLKGTNNWNQVCNSGIAYGAMATYEDHPDLSVQIINRAIQTMALPMQQYAPDGAYPEGYGYWGYGTSFNVMFISALESAFGKDFGLSEKPGFLKTISYLENMIGPSGKPFNYSDCGIHAEFNPATFWFSDRLKDPSLMWVEKQQLAANMPLKNRLLPAAMIWGKSARMNKIVAPKSAMWVGRGSNPVALMRTSWTDPNAIFIGFKGGSPSLNHAHMDAGSFIVEADAVRWGIDFGMQDYESLESKKIDLWNGKQNSQRWKIFRYNNLAHNTLSVNNELQNVNGSAQIIRHSASPAFMYAIADLTTLYTGKVSKLNRGVAIVNQNYVVIRDEVQTVADSITIRWSMVTPAKVKIINESTAELSKDGKKLVLKVHESAGVRMKVWPTEPKTYYDAPNPDTRIVGFEVKVPPNSKKDLTVLLVPQKAENKISKIIPLSQWPH